MNIAAIAAVAPVIPVLTIERAETAVPLARALVKGGLPVLEITLRTEAALEALRANPLPHVLNFAGLKNTAAVWNEETCKGLADRAVPVLRKYPWGGRIISFLETGAGVEEVALGLFVLPVGLATAKAWQADAAAIAAAA